MQDDSQPNKIHQAPEPIRGHRRLLVAIQETRLFRRLGGAGRRELEQLLVTVADQSRMEGHADGLAEGMGAGWRLGYQAQAQAVPAQFLAALQKGTAAGEFTLDVDGLKVTLVVSSDGTGRPDPAAGPAWQQLCAAVSEVSVRCAEQYTPHHICPSLPREIAAARWAAPDGRPIRVTQPAPRRRCGRASWGAAVIAPLTPMLTTTHRILEQLASPAAAASVAVTVGVGTAVIAGAPAPVTSVQPSQVRFVPPRVKLVDMETDDRRGRPRPSNTPTTKPPASAVVVHSEPASSPPPAAPTKIPAPVPSAPAPQIPDPTPPAQITPPPVPAASPPAVQDLAPSPPVEQPSILVAPGE